MRQVAELYVEHGGAPRWAVDACLVQAHSESGGRPLVGLGTLSTFPGSYRGQELRPNRKASKRLQDGEARAARIGYERNRRSYGQSPFPDRDWTFGSGGLYGLLPSTAFSAFRSGKNLGALARGELSPLDVFDPVRATGFYIEMCRRVTRTKQWAALPSQHRNGEALKRAGAALSLVGDYKLEKKRSRSIHENFARRVAGSGARRSYRGMVLQSSDFRGWPGVWEAIQAVEDVTR